ncbi:MAG: GTP cyclohydrolase II RibA [Flavobacteriales bacterium]|nr:GTP cyclohydrolase II RibA [Flavobacteriales bacterium]
MGKLVSSRLPSKWGEYTISAFGDEGEEFPHVAMYRGLDALDGTKPVPVRIHSECMTGDVFGSARCDCGEQLAQSLAHFKEHGGVLVYLRQEGRGIGLVEKLRAYNRQDEGMDTYAANRAGGHDDDARNYDDAVDILKELGVEHVLLLTNNPLKMQALERAGYSVERQKCTAPVTADNADYLKAKAEITGHLL